MNVFVPILVIGFILVVSFYVTAAAARRLGRTPDTALPAGITMVEGPGCRLCPEVKARLAALGVTPHLIHGPPGKLEALRVRGIPTVFVVGDDGSIKARRTGDAALADLEELVSMLG